MWAGRLSFGECLRDSSSFDHLAPSIWGSLTSRIMNGMRGQMEVLRGDFQDKDGDDPLVWVGEESSLSGSDVALLCRNSLSLCRWWTMAPPSE